MSYLDEILRHTTQEVQERKHQRSLADLKSLSKDQTDTKSFLHAIQNSPRPLALIAEIKRASPSEGVIRKNFDPIKIAYDYKTAGASCLSVLTDKKYFQGSLQHLRQVSSNCSLPVLRKDFILEEYQVYEARAFGADAILLIVAALSTTVLRSLIDLSHSLDLDTLVEVHSEPEVEIALKLGCPLIGINHRNLNSFQIDLKTSETLIPLIKKHATIVAESGLSSNQDIRRMLGYGADAVLIGTTFCRANNIQEKVWEVMGW